MHPAGKQNDQRAELAGSQKVHRGLAANLRQLLIVEIAIRRHERQAFFPVNVPLVHHQVHRFVQVGHRSRLLIVDLFAGPVR